MPGSIYIGKKLHNASRLLQQKGALALLNAALKQLFPSGNYFLSWESRILLHNPMCSPQCAQPAVPLIDESVSTMLGFNNQSEKSIAAARGRGEVCWVIQEQGRPVAYVWISGAAGRVTSDTGYRIETEAGAAYWWRDLYVCPEFRGRGLPAILLSSWRHSVDPQEITDIYTEVAPADLRSLKAHQKLGYKVIGSLYMFCIMGARFYYVTQSRFPRFGFRFFPHNAYFSSSV